MRALLLALAWALGCGAGPPRVEEPVAQRGEPLTFAFGTIDGRVVTGENTRGRVTLLLFVTTFDLPSQVAARRVAELVHSHVPKVQALAVVLEAAENAVLADVFSKSLGLSCPVALADSVELRASASFSNLARVPALVVLDREGRLVHQSVGLFSAKELDGWVKEAQR